MTIVTLQTLVNEYEKYSAGYFDLILIDECHRSTLARMFDDVFADKKPSPTTRHADFVVSGMGPDDSVDGNARIKRFENEPLPQILVSVNMLDTGLDCATVSSEDGRLVTCPPVVEYGREFQARAAEELAGLPEGSIILEMLSDYAVMHDQARACE
ncbi:hypothetical protein V5F34_22565 [Xanthobacter autotrophicus]|uniref:hypothetical protein n=1 Tax=Xanthobacter autotrophicus TaxID=280 RepID=UPI0037269424